MEASKKPGGYVSGYLELAETKSKRIPDIRAKEKGYKKTNIHKRSIKIMKTTLVIMVAGIGSRFGGGIKQLEPVGPNGEIIMDYSIHDAIEAGFNKIIFIIRKDIEDDFREVIGNRIKPICE